MSSQTGKRNLLFVVSNDYGELSSALDFIARRQFETLILVPDRLFRANGGDLPVACRSYHSVADVLSAARAQSPDVVFLFTAYLYAVNGLLSLDDVRRLIEGLRAVSRVVVTSDPFLGKLFQLDDSTFSDEHPAKRQLTEHFAMVVRLLDGMKHLYRVEPPAAAKAGSVSFYNPHAVLDDATRAARTAKALNTLGVIRELKRWLFVLSDEDYGVGVARWGKSRFDALLASKLKETASAGRQPVLIGPSPCIGALRQGASHPSSALLLQFCEYMTFQSLLCEAEYCFYWNIFSDSIIARVMNRQTVFFFDAGHLVRAMPRFFEVGLKHFYAGTAPHFLDLDATLSAEGLAVIAVDEDRKLVCARQRFTQSPDPEEVVELLLRSADMRGGDR